MLFDLLTFQADHTSNYSKRAKYITWLKNLPDNIVYLWHLLLAFRTFSCFNLTNAVDAFIACITTT